MQCIRYLIVAGMVFGLAGALFAGKIAGSRQSSRLYTAPDPALPGGIRGQVAGNSAALLDVFAIPTDNQLKFVYQGELAADGTGFSFAGLPVAKYDLLIVCGDRFYEGLTLGADQSTLTPNDLQLIETMLKKSVPFFNEKKTHRIVGATGRAGKARGVVQWVRTLPITLQSAVVLTNIQVRSIKLAFVEDVGEIGWQLVETREIIRTEVGPDDTKGILPHTYCAALNGIRVVDEIKDLGTINLTATPGPGQPAGK